MIYRPPLSQDIDTVLARRLSCQIHKTIHILYLATLSREMLPVISFMPVSFSTTLPSTAGCQRSRCLREDPKGRRRAEIGVRGAHETNGPPIG